MQSDIKHSKGWLAYGAKGRTIWGGWFRVATDAAGHCPTKGGVNRWPGGGVVSLVLLVSSMIFHSGERRRRGGRVGLSKARGLSERLQESSTGRNAQVSQADTRRLYGGLDQP
eukprot:1826832-Pleurochrysis_carterae.AAC.2